MIRSLLILSTFAVLPFSKLAPISYHALLDFNLTCHHYNHEMEIINLITTSESDEVDCQTTSQFPSAILEAQSTTRAIHNDALLATSSESEDEPQMKSKYAYV